jgi:hypothetical protein
MFWTLYGRGDDILTLSSLIMRVGDGGSGLFFKAESVGTDVFLDAPMGGDGIGLGVASG